MVLGKYKCKLFEPCNICNIYNKKKTDYGKCQAIIQGTADNNAYKSFVEP